MSDVRVIVGGGGVGKTTAVSCLSIYASFSKKTLALTFDPSLRLKDVLDKDLTKENKNLDVFLINPQEIFEHLLSQVDIEDKTTFKTNKLFEHLLERIVGLQEFTSLYYLNLMVKSGEYECIYVDTPPFQNALEFFESPTKLKSLFESKVLNFFVETEHKGFFGNLIKTSSRAALKTLKSLTGLDFFKQLLDFISVLEKVRPLVVQTLNESEQSFRTGKISIDYISSYNSESVNQAAGFISELRQRGLNVQRYYLSKYTGNLASFLTSEISHEPVWQLLRSKEMDNQMTEKELHNLSTRYKLEIIRIPYIKAEEKLVSIAERWDAFTE